MGLRRTKPARRPKGGFLRSAGGSALLLLMTLGFLTLTGCATINRFIFIPTKGISATPASRNIPFREVWFQAPGGVRLNGWFIPGTPTKSLVLFFHGNTGNLTDNLDYIKLLHSEGFPIFIFDYRGYGKSVGEAVAEDDLYQDARSAISYLEATGWRHERMIYFGQSLGAAVALQMALESSSAGLVMEGSFTRLKEVVRHISPFGYYSVGWWGIDLPFDNLGKIADVNMPVLLIHGENDAVVPLEMTLRLYDRAAEPKMLHVVRGGGHCDAFTAGSAAYVAAWERYLGMIELRTAARDVRP